MTRNTPMKPDPQNISKNEETSPLYAAWGGEMKLAVCEKCDWQFIFQDSQPLPFCPHCYLESLVNLSLETSQQIVIDEPELILPLGLQAAQIQQIFIAFAGGNWFPPKDLNAKNLISRKTLLYLPIWLVDSSVKATWKAEAGFNYQVLSHQDRFDDSRGGWSSQEVKETRVRWEERIGQMQRIYQNHTSPALQEHSVLMQQVGPFDLALAKPFLSISRSDKGWAACLPNRSKTDSWTDAQLGIQASAAKECQQACQSDTLRSFSWEPEFSDQRWTLLLVPVISTFYVDDEGKPQALLINGQTGKLGGVKRASIQRARKTSISLLAAAACIFIVSLLLSLGAVLFPPLLIVGVLGFVITLLVGLSAIVPFAVVWKTNR
jgi:hypothetical protein